MSYDNDKYSAKHVTTLEFLGVTGDAALELARFKFFVAAKLTGIKGAMTVAGKATTSSLMVYNGTTSLCDIACSTFATSVIDATVAETNFATTDNLIIKNASATDVLSGHVEIQWQERFAG